MRAMGRWVLLMGCVHGPAAAGGSLDDALRVLPSARTVAADWPRVEQIEHKDGWVVRRGAVCVGLEDLLQRFPARDGSGLYWDYMSQQSGRQAAHQVLGRIGGSTVTEVVLTFRAPEYYVKLVGFSPAGEPLICPFLLVADLSMQLAYAPSTVVRSPEGDAVHTVMQDAVAFGTTTPQPVWVTVGFDAGRPARVVMDERLAAPEPAD